MIQVEVLAEAAEDLENIARRYESRRVGLGDAFLDAQGQLFERIEENPQQFPIMYKDVRRALMRRFPVATWFRLTGYRGLVIAIIDLRRRPGLWQTRQLTDEP